MRHGDIFALTPPGVTDANLAIAACRAGARGVLDLEYVNEPSQARTALSHLAGHVAGPFGV